MVGSKEMDSQCEASMIVAESTDGKHLKVYWMQKLVLDSKTLS